MSQHAVIQATFHTHRPVAGRRVLQLVFEVPIEKQNEVLRVLGPAFPTESKWVAIAALDPSVAASTDSSPQGPKETGPKPRESSPGLVEAMPEAAGEASDTPPRIYKRSQIAFNKCRDINFQKWIGCVPELIRDGLGEKEAAFLLCNKLGIDSRAELDSDESKANAWDALLTSFDMRAYTR